MAKTKIEWTGMSWNPVTGCTKISPGCLNCYAEKMAKRLKAMGQKKYENEFKVTLHEYALEEPLKIKKPHNVFVNSMSDLFHKDVPFDFIQKVFEVMRKCHWHRFQILTKRSKRLLQLNSQIDWPVNVWMGVSVENEDYLYRIDNLRNTGAFMKFISFEPLLGPVKNFNPENIDWVIAGGESGPGSRVVLEEWVLTLKEICVKEKVAFFFKQWGGTNKKKSGRLLRGVTWEQYPDVSKALLRRKEKLSCEKLIPEGIENMDNEYNEQLFMNIKS